MSLIMRYFFEIAAVAFGIKCSCNCKICKNLTPWIPNSKSFDVNSLVRIYVKPTFSVYRQLFLVLYSTLNCEYMIVCVWQRCYCHPCKVHRTPVPPPISSAPDMRFFPYEWWISQLQFHFSDVNSIKSSRKRRDN